MKKIIFCMIVVCSNSYIFSMLPRRKNSLLKLVLVQQAFSVDQTKGVDQDLLNAIKQQNTSGTDETIETMQDMLKQKNAKQVSSLDQKNIREVHE